MALLSRNLFAVPSYGALPGEWRSYFAYMKKQEEIMTRNVPTPVSYVLSSGMAKEWEVIAFDEARRRAFFLDREESIPLPELRGKSDILTDPLCLALTVHLPARAQGYPWTLVYNTNAHGFSLKTLYRKMQEIDSPTLFLVKDVNEHIFGAIVSCAFKVAEHFYGTGESALFSFHPTFRVSFLRWRLVGANLLVEVTGRRSTGRAKAGGLIRILWF